MGLQQLLADRPLEAGCTPLPFVLGEDSAGKGVAVGVEAARRQPQQQVAGANRRSIDDVGTGHDADDETGQVVVVAGIEVGKLGGFAPDEGHPSRRTGVGDAGHDLGRNVRVELADRQVVKEEERIGAVHGDVVDAVVHQVDADRAVTAQRDGHL